MHTLFAKLLIKVDKIEVGIFWKVVGCDDVAFVVTAQELGESQPDHPLPQHFPAVLVPNGNRNVRPMVETPINVTQK